MSPLNYARLSLMMFIQFFLWGAWYVAGRGYLLQVGFDAGDFGWMYSVGPIAGMISPFFVGMIADRFFATERVLGVMHLLGAAAMFAAAALTKLALPEVLVPWRPELVNLMFFAHMLCFFPTLALSNTIAMHTMTDPEKQFPLIRVFGTIGWIAGNMILDVLGIGRSVYMLYLAAGSGVVLGLYCFTLPHTPPPSAGKAVSIRQILGLDALVLLKRPAYLAFMISSFLICIPLAFYYQLAFATIDQAGFTTPASIMSLGQWSEIGFMLLMPLVFSRLGVKWMLFVGMLAWVARYGLFTLGAPAPSVLWMLIIGVVLHGICYDFFFVTGQIYTDQVAPNNIRGQAQGMLVLFTLGLGMLIGAQVAGYVEGANTPPKTHTLQAEAAAVGLAVETSSADLKKLHDAFDGSKKKAFKELREKAAKPVAEADKTLTADFIEKVNLETKVEEGEVVASQKRLDELMKDRNASKEAVKKAKGNVDDRLKKKVEKMVLLADDLADAQYANLAKGTDHAEAFKLARRADLLSAYQREISVEALRAMNWKMIWMIPAIFAAVIMVLFVLVFHDKGERKAPEDKFSAAGH